MKGSAWVGLIRRIPEAQQENLVAVTGTGAEIMVQKILVMDEEFIIFRGRPAGSTEAPRILFMPFDQLNHLAFNKPLQESEVKAMFGNEAAAPTEAPTKAPAVPPIAAEQPAGETPSGPVSRPANSPASAPAPLKGAPPSKSILLERLRERLSRR